jgi:hypothetical protein
MSTKDGGTALVRVLQLHNPLNEFRFSFLGTVQPVQRLANGTEIVRSLGSGRSSVPALCVTDEGLLVLLQVLSPSAANPTGFPTTTMSTIPVPATMSALTLSQATADVLSISMTRRSRSRYWRNPATGAA